MLTALTDNDYLKSIWVALTRLEGLLATPVTAAPQPNIVVSPPDLSEIVTAVTGLRPSVTAEEIAQAVGKALHFPEPQNANEALTEVAAALKKLEFRLKGLGTQAYGGGAVTLERGQTIAVTGALTDTQLRASAVPVSGTFFQATQPVSLATAPTTPVTGTFFQATQPVSNTFLTNQTGTWAYYAGASGTVNVTAGQKVLGIAAHATTAGSMTINGGSSVPIPATVGVQWSPLGNLVAPTLVFTGTDSYMVEVVS